MATKTELMGRLADAEAKIARLQARDQPTPVRDQHAAMRAIMAACADSEQEEFVVVLLDARQKVLGTRTIARGSVSQVDVHPRDVFRPAIRMNAHSVIVGHNHPSGAAEPSVADIELTGRLVAAGRLVGVPVLDHIIVTTVHGATSLASIGKCG